MSFARAIVLTGCAMIIGGCAGGQTRQEMARLQSHIGLLDERVSQLERSLTAEGLPAAGGASSTDWSVSSPVASPSNEAPSTGSQPTPPPTGKPNTRDVQQALKNAGFYQGSIDGKMGPMTRAAIKEFQRVHGLTDDGVAGKHTWTKLSAYTSLSSATGSDK